MREWQDSRVRVANREGERSLLLQVDINQKGGHRGVN